MEYWNGDIRSAAWLEHVDGAKLLRDVINDISSSKIEFRKTTHSLGILGKIMDIDPDNLVELFNFLQSVLDKAAAGRDRKSTRLNSSH